MLSFGRIEGDIFVGSTPQNSVDIARLAQMKITAVLSLQSDQDHKTHRIDWLKLSSVYDYNDITVERFPIIDFDPVDMSKNLSAPVVALHELLSKGNRIYVHCNAGVCRAPATVLAYLCHYRGMSIDRGLGYIRENRPQANPYLDAVKIALEAMATNPTD